jgi:hypothetical protein
MNLSFKPFYPLTAALLFASVSIHLFSQTTRLNLLVKAVESSFSYGKSNRAMQPYKISATGLQLGASFQAGITDRFSVVPELYFIMKGGVLKSDNSITINKSPCTSTQRKCLS